MLRRLANLTLDTLADLPRPCRGCVFWELHPAGQAAEISGDWALEKEAWVSRALLEWGSCGKLAYVDDTPAGYVLYAPPSYLPGCRSFPSSPPSADAVVLAAIRVAPAFSGSGIGRMLVQAAARDLAHRRVRAMEAFGDHRYGEPAGPLPGAPGAAGTLERPAPSADRRCVAPAEFFVAVGFKTVRPHPRYPRLRLELRTAASEWSGVDYAEAELRDVLWPVGSALASLALSSRTSMEPVGTSDSAG